MSFFPLLLLMQSVVSPVGAQEAVVNASPAPGLSPSPSIAPSPSSTPEVFGDEEKRKLKTEYRSALRAAERAFDHQESSALREFQAAQTAASRAWRERERQARRLYFEKHSTGPEQRQYVLGFVERKKEFDAKQGLELQAERRTWRDKREAHREKLKERQKKFLDDLNAGRRPAKELWDNL
jgi:hypothetical protein